MVEFRMPSLGADMEAGTLVEWLVKPGDRVKRGDIVAVVETQKGAIEIETFETGRIDQLLVDLNTKVPVGTPLARIASEQDTAKTGVATVPLPIPGLALETTVLPAAPRPSPPRSGVVPPTMGRVRASPAARQLAQSHGVNLAALTGSGTAGAIVRADVERSISAAAMPPPDKKRAIGLDLDAMRTAIGSAMARSKREIPHYYLQHQVDATACEQWLNRMNATRPPEKRLLIGAIAIKSVASATRRFPAFNGFFRDGKFEPAAAAHVGIAIAIRGGGLAAPALHNVDQLPLDVLMTQMRDLVQRMRAGRIRSSEMSDPTITVSSLGERGVEALYGIIYPPQVAIVGFGKVVARPWAVGNSVEIRSVVTMTLSADHRVSDGHSGALFLAEIGKLLQEPEKL